ncbi:Hint domain-containing protein [Paracoccus sp. KR1-242]|uniref:Hint domain-containing protein n=1 Tax=Paracoccus sp. KR1-242 TaxID=3410028 RepID=UPI003C056AC8
MATYILPPDAVAVGSTNQQAGETVITPTSLPINDFLISQGYDPADAVVTITIDDQYIVDDEDLDGDGTPDPYIPDDTPVSSFEIDADGDGTADYYVAGQGSQASELSTNNQYSGNTCSYSGGFYFHDSETGEEVDSVNGTIFITTDGTFTPGVSKPVVPMDNGGIALDDLVVVCFTRGTWITTPDGPRLIEELAVGDLVTTLDQGPQPIRWIGSRRLSRGTLARLPNLRPIRIAAGALGPGLPETDLVVSPQHRMLLSSPIVRRLFETDEVLVPAKKLLGQPGIAEEAAQSVEYFHILLDRHQVVIANGAPSETLLVGQIALRALGAEARREISLIFPEIALPGFTPVPARQLAAPRRIGKLVERHVRNGHHLCQQVRSAAS